MLGNKKVVIIPTPFKLEHSRGPDLRIKLPPLLLCTVFLALYSFKPNWEVQLITLQTRRSFKGSCLRSPCVHAWGPERGLGLRVRVVGSPKPTVGNKRCTPKIRAEGCLQVLRRNATILEPELRSCPNAQLLIWVIETKRSTTPQPPYEKCMFICLVIG